MSETLIGGCGTSVLLAAFSSAQRHGFMKLLFGAFQAQQAVVTSTPIVLKPGKQCLS